jgi:hypothetical protein
MRERKYFRKAVINRSINGGRLTLQAYVFFPYGRFEIASHTALLEAVPTFYRKVLRVARPDLAARDGIDPSRWWMLSRNTKLKPGPKIISTYFGGPGKFAFDPVGDWVTVQGYSYSFRDSYQSVDMSAILHAYLLIFNSDFFAGFLDATSNRVAGGQFNLSVRFVKDVPLPRLEVVDRDLLARMRDIGRCVQAGEPYEREEAEALVIRAYSAWRGE